MKYELGINRGISDQDYHHGPGISSSGVKLVRRSPLHFWDQYLNPQKKPIDSDSLRLGRATHCLILEPDRFDERYVIEPNINKRTKAGKAEYAQWLSENASKTIITSEQRQQAECMREAVLAHPRAMRLLQSGQAEQSLYWIDPSTNKLCKVRPDYLRAGIIADIKTTRDAAKRAFERDIAHYQYHLSAAMYLEGCAHVGLDAEHFVLIVVESARPFVCAVYDIQDIALDRGRELFSPPL